MALIMSLLLNNIVNRSYCLGCGLCASLAARDAVEMVAAPDGFLVPRVKTAEADLSFLREVCPGIRIRREPARDDARSIYGPFQSLHAAHAADEAVRWRASSGGVITALLLHLLETRQVDGVLQVGADPEDPLRSRAVLSRTREEVIRCAGSRYAPASLLEGWKELMRSGLRVAVVGKPCDAAAVRNVLRLHPAWGEQVVCLVSFFCMGMPSRSGTQRLVEEMGAVPGDIREFRYRGHGWPGKAAAVGPDGREYTCSYSDSWGKVLSRTVHFRCKICPDGFGGQADIACGDAWHDENGKPSFEERPGRSLVFVRTDTGAALFRKALESGRVCAEPYPLEKLSVIQPSQVQRRIHVGARLAALKLLGDRMLRFTGFRMLHHLRRSTIRLTAWNFWGMLQRRLKWKGPAKV